MYVVVCLFIPSSYRYLGKSGSPTSSFYFGPACFNMLKIPKYVLTVLEWRHDLHAVVTPKGCKRIFQLLGGLDLNTCQGYMGLSLLFALQESTAS